MARSGSQPSKRHHVVVAKYDPLLEHLCRADDGPLEMTFEEIGRLVGGLPASAATWPAWWANETAGSRHVQARAWLDSGRVIESVDRAGKRVRFSAAEWRRGS
ncbi:MAG: DUF7662 domain-containing protein [Acidimicrobiales bacterium]